MYYMANSTWHSVVVKQTWSFEFKNFGTCLDGCRGFSLIFSGHSEMLRVDFSSTKPYRPTNSAAYQTMHYLWYHAHTDELLRDCTSWKSEATVQFASFYPWWRTPGKTSSEWEWFSSVKFSSHTRQLLWNLELKWKLLLRTFRARNYAVNDTPYMTFAGTSYQQRIWRNDSWKQIYR